jgi:hypothetical protein
MGQQPAFDGRRLMGPVVVEDQVHVEMGGHFCVEFGEELLELDGTVALMQGAGDLSGGVVQGGEETGGAVPFVVMGSALGHTGQQRQDGLGAVERLDLAFLVDTEHHRPFVRSGRGAVLLFPAVGFPGPSPEPDVRVSTHPALHMTVPVFYAAVSFVAHGEAMAVPL